MSKIVQASDATLKLAGTILRSGGLVVVPTETVYGIAANALDADAVAKIFAAKGRPADNPLIVHIAAIDDVGPLTKHWNATAALLADRFWPGPLTLVVDKSDAVPSVVSGGLETVAIRMPEHPIALEVIKSAGVPLAMPSANRFMELSPTRVEHLDAEVLEKVDLVIDGGPCRVGVESTVIDVVDDPLRILRPGGVTRAEIEAALKRPLSSTPPNARRSPGMYARHYAPRAKLVLVDLLEPGMPGLTFDEAGPGQIRMPLEPRAYAASLYHALHQLDRENPEVIFVEIPPMDADWEAVHDRLRKASA